MPASDSFLDFMLGQLSGLENVTAIRMFGGYGLYRGEDFFGIISGGKLYLLTNENTRKEYVTRGMKPFRPNERQTLAKFYEVPVEILEDAAELRKWAERSAECRTDAPEPRERKRAARRRS